jgi:Zn-dependent protease with chaperone function
LTSGKIDHDEMMLYLEALRFNWDKIKHTESQRLQVFYFSLSILVAALTIIPHLGFPYSILLICFLSFLSFLLYLIIVKQNAETSACFTAIHWISEKLGLIKGMESEEKENFKAELRRIGFKKPPKYVFYKEAYMNIAIPLPIRVHDAMTYFSEVLTAGTWSLTVGFSFYYFVLPSPWISCITSIVLFVVILYLLHHNILRKVKERSVAFKKARKPKGIITWEEGREDLS